MTISRVILYSLLCLAAGCSRPSEPQASKPSEEQNSSDNNSAPATPGENRQVVQLTEAAVVKFKEFLSESPSSHIRLSIRDDNSAGFSYDLKLDDKLVESDFVDRSYGVTIAVDPTSALYLEGTTIDWVNDPDGRAGFQFDNPNAVRVDE